MKEKFILWIKSAFDTHSLGASARKLSAFWIIVLVTFLHIWWARYAYKHEDISQLPTILTLDFGFALSLLGLTTWQGIKDKKDDKSGDKSDTQ